MFPFIQAYGENSQGYNQAFDIAVKDEYVSKIKNSILPDADLNYETIEFEGDEYDGVLELVMSRHDVFSQRSKTGEWEELDTDQTLLFISGVNEEYFEDTVL